MKLTYEQVKILPNGTKFKIFLSGSAWKEDFGKAFNAMKFDDKIYVIHDFFDVDDFKENKGIYDKYEDFTVEAAINENELDVVHKTYEPYLNIYKEMKDSLTNKDSIGDYTFFD